MANLKEIRNRITSIGSTMQITSAMKMVSAAKLKRATDAIMQMRPYSEKLQEILQNVSGTLDLSENAFTEIRTEGKTLVIAVSSNRGLCGGFNNNIIKAANIILNDGNVEVLPVGKKVTDTFKRSPNYVQSPVADMFADLKFNISAEITQYAMDRFMSKEVNKVVVIYNKFVNAATQIVQIEQLLPIAASVNESSASAGDYIYEPDKTEIVQDLIPKSLKVQFFKALLDSSASEHGARMTAMHKATDNAKDLQRSLKLSYNKARQAAITNEILEIVGGAEALKS
jgi:F-type H+-transporting ATPase subunit gamma